RPGRCRRERRAHSPLGRAADAHARGHDPDHDEGAGATLIAATLVIPATIARMCTNSFSRMLLLATAIGAATGFVGMNVSYQLDLQTGPAIVLVGASLFALVFLVT